DLTVTGVQTCALPIWWNQNLGAPATPPRPLAVVVPVRCLRARERGRTTEYAWGKQACAARLTASGMLAGGVLLPVKPRRRQNLKIGRASCRERVQISG